MMLFSFPPSVAVTCFSECARRSRRSSRISPGAGASVLADTRARIVEQRLMLVERPPLWDVDTEVDLARLEREFPELKL